MQQKLIISQRNKELEWEKRYIKLVYNKLWDR